jgi:hypothetical protein
MFYKCFGISAVSTTPARKSQISLQDSCVFYLQDLSWVWFMYSVGALRILPLYLCPITTVCISRKREAQAHTVRNSKRGNLIRMYLVLQDVI